MRVRDMFQTDRNIVHLNNAALGAVPRLVADAVRHYDDMLALQPSHFYYDEEDDYVETSRKRLAEISGCDAEELAITRNASESLNNIIFGLNLKPGDEILSTTHDYPSMLDSIRQRSRREGVTLRTFRFSVPVASPDELTEKFSQVIGSRTRVLLMSHMTWITGQIFPVKSICQMAGARGLLTIVDGAQSFGHFPFKIPDLGCDFFGASLHKYFNAPIGTGLLYVRRSRIPELWPLMGASEKLADDIRKFDGFGTGTQPVGIRNAIPATVDFNQEIGIENKAERLRYLRRRWMSRLGQLNSVKLLISDEPSQSCGTGAFIPGKWDVQKFVDALQQRFRIQVRTRGVAGEFSCVRVSPGIFTTSEEIDRFCEAVEMLIDKPQS